MEETLFNAPDGDKVMSLPLLLALIVIDPDVTDTFFLKYTVITI